MNDKLSALKAALAARKKGKAGKSAKTSKHPDRESAAEDRSETPAQETAEDKGKTLPMAGQNSAQFVPAPKKPNNTKPSSTNLSPSKPRAPFAPNLVKHPKGKGGKAVIPPTKPAGAVYWPKAKTRGA